MYFILLPLLFTINLYASLSNTLHSVEDLQRNIITNINNSKLSINTNKYKKDFIYRYFKPWDMDKMSISKKEAQWGNMYSKKNMYGHNKVLLSKQWFKKVINNSNFSSYNTIKRKAITINETELKVFPTKDAMYLNPSKSGEGYPFDYNMNSSVKINLPLFVSHYSKDGLWGFIESSVSSGWVKIEDIAFVDERFINKFMTNDYYINSLENNILRKYGYIIKNIKFGTLIPKHKKDFLFVEKDLKNNANLRSIDNNTELKPLGLELNSKNILQTMNNLIDEPYSWGGKDGYRDCSLMTKDFFSPFGIFLERNSKAQKSQWKNINIKKYSNKDKKKIILKKGVPFLTLLYMNGHIMLYIGEVNGEPMIMHNMWSLKYWKNGQKHKKIIGKSVITSLEPSNDFYKHNKGNTLLDKINTIVILTKG